MVPEAVRCREVRGKIHSRKQSTEKMKRERKERRENEEKREKTYR